MIFYMQIKKVGHIQVASSELKNERNIYYIITSLLTDRSLWGTSRLVCFFMQVSKKEKYGKLLSHKNNVKKTNQNENEKRRITQIKLQGWNAAVEMGGAVMLQSVHAQWTLLVTCMLKTTH